MTTSRNSVYFSFSFTFSIFCMASLKPDRTTAWTTAHSNCCIRACMYDCTTVRKHDHACSKCPLLQVFKNVFIMGWLESGRLLVGRIGSRVRLLVGRIGSRVVSDSFYILSCAVRFYGHHSWRGVLFLVECVCILDIRITGKRLHRC